MKKDLPTLLLEAERTFDERFLDGGLMADDGDYDYMSVYKDVQEFFRKQILSILSEAEKATEERERKYLHTVVASGSEEDLNDTWRRGFNHALSQVKSLWREWRGNLK